jgi:hypothetical protein
MLLVVQQRTQALRKRVQDAKNVKGLDDFYSVLRNEDAIFNLNYRFTLMESYKLEIVKSLWKLE